MEALILACLIRGLGRAGGELWDPSQLSSSVSLPNHTPGWDEETNHLFLFLLEHYLLTVSHRLSTRENGPQKCPMFLFLFFCCINISATKSGVAEKIKLLHTYSTTGLEYAVYACNHAFSCQLPRHFHVGY